MMRSRRSATAAFLASALVAVSLGFLIADLPPVHATSHDDPYMPCPSQSKVDLLVLMDQSQSLETWDQNRRRAEGLAEIAQLLVTKQDIRIAIVGFKNKATVHREFASLADDPLIQDEIEEATISDGSRTNYLAALDKAITLFEAEPAGQDATCRVLLFFTDGRYDPDPGESEGEVVGAQGLATYFVCGSGPGEGFIKERLLALDIQTFAVLLQEGFGASSQHESEMLDVSLDWIRAVTGDGRSPMVDDVPVNDTCLQWSDELRDQTGEIIAVNDINSLVNDLIKLVKETTQSFYGCPAPDTPSDQTFRYRNLPSGVFFDEIALYIHGGKIASVVAGEEVLQDTPSSRAFLQREVLRDLPSGWVLEVKVLADSPQSNPRLECKSAPVALPPFEGTVQGAPDGRIVDIGGAEIEIDLLNASGDSFPCGDLESFNLEDPRPGFEGELPGTCKQGLATVELSAEPLDDDLEVLELSGYLLPKYAEQANWTAFEFTVTFDPKLTIVSTSNPPKLECTGLDTVLIDDLVSTIQLQAAKADGCFISPPPRTGVVVVSLDWEGGDDPGWRLDPETDGVAEINEEGTEIRLGAGDTNDPKFGIDVRTDVPPDDLWLIEGTLIVEAVWDPGTGIPEPIGLTEIPISEDGLQGQEPTFFCPADLQGKLRTVGSAPDEQELVVEGCSVTAPGVGRVTVNLEWKPDDKESDETKWHLDPETDGVAEINEEGTEIRLGAGDTNDPKLGFDVRTGELTYGLWLINGTLTIKADWTPGGQRVSTWPPHSVDIRIDADRTPDYANGIIDGVDVLACDETLGGFAMREVPEETVSSDGECTVVAPPSGQLKVCFEWHSDDELGKEIDWKFDVREGTDTDPQDPCLLLNPEDPEDSEDDVLVTGFVTTEELANTHWDQVEGTVEVTATWYPPDRDSEEIVGQEELDASINLLARSDTGAALVIALLLAIAAAVITYGGLYAVLRWQDRLPDPKRLYYVEKDLRFALGASRKLVLRTGEELSPTADDLRRVTGNVKKLTVGSITIRAHTVPPWNVVGLMAGGHGEVDRKDQFVYADPSASETGTVDLHFQQLTLITLDPRSATDDIRGTVTFVVSRGATGGIPAVEKLVEDLSRNLRSASDPYQARRQVETKDDDKLGDGTPRSGPEEPRSRGSGEPRSRGSGEPPSRGSR